MLNNADCEVAIEFWQGFVEKYICSKNAPRNTDGIIILTKANTLPSFNVNLIKMKDTPNIAQNECSEDNLLHLFFVD